MRTVLTLMSPRASRVLTLIDRALGAFLATFVLLFAGSVYAVSGAPKAYEIGPFGRAYAGFLQSLEAAAYELRTDYCVNTDPRVQACASFAPQRTAPPVRDEAPLRIEAQPKVDLLGGDEDDEIAFAGASGRPGELAWFGCQDEGIACDWLIPT